ncbi:3-isopropylmalate dehydrogenase, partial [bacterium]|nr:3-isopropylmalate dehydrogenase [bacterium]
IINPLAAICAMGMLLDEVGEPEAAQAIEDAVKLTTPKMQSMSAGRMGFSTSEVGDLVAKAVS